MGEKKRKTEAGWKPRDGQKIDKLYAWICEEPDGGEGVPASPPDRNGLVMPLFGADLKRVESFRADAEATARHFGYPMRLVEFSGRRVIEEIDLVALKKKAN